MSCQLKPHRQRESRRGGSNICRNPALAAARAHHERQGPLTDSSACANFAGTKKRETPLTPGGILSQTLTLVAVCRVSADVVCSTRTGRKSSPPQPRQLLHARDHNSAMRFSSVKRLVWRACPDGELPRSKRSNELRDSCLRRRSPRNALHFERLGASAGVAPLARSSNPMSSMKMLP